MSKQWQIRRGTTIENDAFTGAQGELTMDTTSKGIRVHDGTTQGGIRVRTLVSAQYPTSQNDFTWAFEYSDGWVEQGGRAQLNGSAITVNLPITMSDTNYTVLLNATSNTDGWPLAWENSSVRTAATFYVDGTGNIGGSSRTIWFDWEVKGMAA